jgi:hypothetical protein
MRRALCSAPTALDLESAPSAVEPGDENPLPCFDRAPVGTLSGAHTSLLATVDGATIAL